MTPADVRSHVLLLAAGGVLATAAVSAGSPAPAALALPVLDAVVIMVAMRGGTRATLFAALLAAPGFLLIRLASSPGEPGASMAWPWTSGLLGAAVVVGSALLALRCWQGLRAGEEAIAGLASRVGPEPLGRARAEWLLAEAREGRRLVTLGLVGVDAPGEWELEPGEREKAMSGLDEVLRTASEIGQAAGEYGPWERLLVLPDVWAEDLRESAESLVKTARQRIGRQVRVALITFPLDGPPGVEPIEYLERSLEVCRAGRTSVSVGRPSLRRIPAGPEIA